MQEMEILVITCKEIDYYIKYCELHPNEINEDRKLLIENIVMPILARNDVFFDENMYKNCLFYCENNYYPLFLYQKFIYAFVFMYVDDVPLFSTILIFMGRGNGKDGFLMPLCSFLTTPLHGIEKYHIDIVANSEEQAKDTFSVVYDMLEGNQKFKDKFYISKEKIMNYKTKSRIIYNTSNAKTKDGKKTGAVVLNELHAYEDSSQIDVFTSGLGKIKHPRTFIITTNGNVREGPLDEYLDVSRQVLRTGENLANIFPFLCSIDDIKEFDQPGKWHKANPSLKYMPVLQAEMNKAYQEIKLFPSKKAEFIAKRMNLPSSKEESAIANWENILATSYSNTKEKIIRKMPSLENNAAIIGIDYADVRDFVSAGLLFKEGDEYIYIQKTWICKRSPFFDKIKFPFQNAGEEGFKDFEVVDTENIPIETVVEWCVEQMEEYQVKKIVMDTYRYTLFKTIFIQYGISIESKDNPYGIVRLIRRSNSVYALIAPLIEKLLTDKKINFGNSAIMRWYTNNTGTTEDKFGNKLFTKIEPKLRKTDGFMSFVHSMQAREELDEVIIYI